MIENAVLQRGINAMPGPKSGDRLFEGTNYPRTWDDYVGQENAVEFIRASCVAARIQNRRLPHTLIACGAGGVGKTALGLLAAKEMGVGIVQVQGAIDAQDALRIFAGVSDRDIIYWDEFHLAVSKGKAKAEWLLSALVDGVLITPKGVHPIPDVTFLAATTDMQKLPETIIRRFPVQPVLKPYTDAQAQEIARVAAVKVFNHPSLVQPDEWTRRVIAKAGNNNPRAIMKLLETLRDSALAGKCVMLPDGSYSLDTMFRWTDITPDGLDRIAQDYLIVLSVQFFGKAGEKTIAAALGEPTAPRWTEQLLIQKGFLQITPGGRELTAEGLIRAQQLIDDKVMETDES